MWSGRLIYVTHYEYPRVFYTQFGGLTLLLKWSISLPESLQMNLHNVYSITTIQIESKWKIKQIISKRRMSYHWWINNLDRLIIPSKNRSSTVISSQIIKVINYFNFLITSTILSFYKRGSYRKETTVNSFNTDLFF